MFLVLLLVPPGWLCPPPPRPASCSPAQFRCRAENRNQILSINDWNREREKCIPAARRCDGRHDCQVGSEE